MIEELKEDDIDLGDVTSLFRVAVARKIASTAFWDEIYGNGTATDDRTKLRFLRAACDLLAECLEPDGSFFIPLKATHEDGGCIAVSQPEPRHLPAQVIPIR